MDIFVCEGEAKNNQQGMDVMKGKKKLFKSLFLEKSQHKIQM